MALDKKNGGASSAGARFLKEPKAFDGVDEERAATWLSRMNRLKKSAKISDEEMLLIVEENLVDKAESWWNVVGSKAETWEAFEIAFKKQYLSDLEDRWWSAIYDLKQGTEYRSVDEVAIRMEELFNLLGNQDQGLLVRTFLNAINSNIAYEVEKENRPATFAIAKERARQVEKSQLKYGVTAGSQVGKDAAGPKATTLVQEQLTEGQDFSDVKSESSAMSSVMSLVDKLEKLSINLVALQDAVVNNSKGNSNGNSYGGAPRRAPYSGGGIVCFLCGEPGHKKLQQQGLGKSQRVSAVEVADTPIPNPLPSPASLNLIDTVVDAEELNEVYNVKRGHPEVPEVVNSNTRAAKKKRLSPGQVISQEIAMKDARPPRRARVLKVPTKSLSVWSKLAELDSGLSVLDWLAIDKDAAKDLVDGLRDLRKQRPKRSKRHLNDMDGGIREPLNKVNVVDHVSDTDSSSYESDSSDGSMVSSAASNTDSDLNFDDTQSVYRYPYDLSKMKWSSPLKAEISINGKKVIACFDTGGSISVISRSLCESLGMAYNGDSLQLVGFNNESAGARADIVMDVPICIQGKHIRPEHMCVQDQTNADLLILGIPWLQAYGVELDIANSIIKVPTTSGLVKLQGFTSHIPGLVPNKGKEVYKIELARKHAASLEDDLIPDTYEEVKYDKANIMEGAPDFVHDLLKEFSHVFSEVSGLTKIKGHKMRVQVIEGAKPVKSKCFRLTWEDEDALNKYVDEMLELDLIEESDGTWSSAAFLVGKKDGSRRCVIDYRKVNKMIVQTNFPTPTVAELTELTAGMNYFSCLDASSGYHQLEIDPEDTLARNLTGFVTKRGCWRYKVLPMGISVGGSEFQKCMHSIFKDMVAAGSACIFYDDVLVFSRTKELHEQHLRELFKAAEKANLKFKRKKCHFGQDSVEYLGHIISSEGSRPGERNVEKIKAFPPCKNVSELKSFLGLTGFFRKFTPQYASIAKDLISLTKKGVKFTWGEAQQQAFDTLKLIQCSNPVLAFPDRDQVQVLSVDGSLSGLGCVLTQTHTFNEQDRTQEKVIGYGSRSLRGAEANWHIHEVEAFAVVWGIQHFRHFLKGRKFVLITDHSSLVYIFNPSKNTPKLSRWCAAVMEYNFDILYKPGPSNIADALSRCIPLPEFIKEFGPAQIG